MKQSENSSVGQEANDEKKSFKKHPAFGRKERRSSSMKNARQSVKNPITMIMEQHREKKANAAKLIFVVFAVMILLALAGYFYGEWKDKVAEADFIASVQEEIEPLELAMESTIGYERDIFALRALMKLKRIEKIAPLKIRQWKRQKDKYISFLARSFPVTGTSKGENFVNATAFCDMVHIPPGRFNMGKRAKERGDKDELPRHPVVIPREFWISRTEVTNWQYRTLYPNRRINKWARYTLDAPHQPVVKVNWHMASAFCRRLTKKEKEAGRLPNGYEYRLPTEAEWEYTCRAGTESYYYWGDEFGSKASEFCNSRDLATARLFDWKRVKDMAPDDKYRVSAPVAFYKPNAFGLYDITGNAWEWCYDWYNPAAYKELKTVAPVQTKPLVVELEKRGAFHASTFTIETTCKVIRGGSWGNAPNMCRSANRDFTEAEDANTGIGFRIVLAPVIAR